jgi:hypothetical protein
MEYQQKRETVMVNELLYDGCEEQPIDLSLTLPDYCPDLQKILKCQVTPSITSSSVMGDSVDIQGVTTVRVLYLDIGGDQVRCYETTTNFSCRIPVQTTTGSGVVVPRVQVEYVNCRATGSRRLDIHGAFSLCAAVWEQREVSFLSGVEGDQVEQHLEDHTITVSNGLTQQLFSVEEVLSLGEGKPNAESLLRTDGTINVEELRPVDGQLLLKGTIDLKVLYLTDLRDALPETMAFVLPFQQQLDCGISREQDRLNVSLTLLGVTVKLQQDASGENSLLAAECKVLSMVQSYGETAVSMVDDVYDRAVEVTLEREQQTLLQYEGAVTERCSQKETLEFPEQTISKVIDVWSENCRLTTTVSEKGIDYQGTVRFCVLGKNSEGRIFYGERTLEVHHTRETETQGITRSDTSWEMGNVSYRITGGSALEVKWEMTLRTTLFRSETVGYLEAAIPNEDMVHPKDRSASLVLYYSEGGQSLWDIAKAYHTGVVDIQRENHLTEPVIDEPMMVLIPV